MGVASGFVWNGPGGSGMNRGESHRPINDVTRFVVS